MTKERFQHLLDTVPGIGVSVVVSGGIQDYFFYEDFDGPGSGIQRAMKQIYPSVDKGYFESVTFIHGRGSR